MIKSQLKSVSGFNVVYQQFRATCMYDSGCQICCNWSRLQPGLICQHNEIPCHR